MAASEEQKHRLFSLFCIVSITGGLIMFALFDDSGRDYFEECFPLEVEDRSYKEAGKSVRRQRILFSCKEGTVVRFVTKAADGSIVYSSTY